MITVLEILERARTGGQRLPYNEAAVLFAAAVRLAAANDSTLRARLIQIDDAGGLHLMAFDEARAREGGDLRVKSSERLRDAVIKALGRIHALLDSGQRAQLAYLIRTGVLSL